MPVFKVKTIEIVVGRYGIGSAESHIRSFELENDLEFYTTDEFTRLVIDKYKGTKAQHIYLSDRVMQHFYEKDKVDLMKTGVTEEGDPFTVWKSTHYLDKKTNNRWTIEICRGSGIHGVNGMFYVYHSHGFEFKSDPHLVD